MQLRLIPIAALSFASLACGSNEASGAGACTIEAVGRDTGADNLRASLRVPPAYNSGVEVRNGGVSVEWGDCDFPLNALLSEETVTSVIANAPIMTLTDTRHDVRLVEAEMAIWRFFVTRVHSMVPILTPRNAEERERFELPTNGS